MLELQDWRYVLDRNVLERLGHAVDGRAPDVVGAQEIDPLRGRAAPEEWVQRATNLVAPRVGNRRILVRRQLGGAAQDLTDRLDRGHRDREMTVRCRIEAVRNRVKRVCDGSFGAPQLSAVQVVNARLRL